MLHIVRIPVGTGKGSLTAQGMIFRGRVGFAHLMVRLTGSSTISKAALVTIFVGLTTKWDATLTGVVTMEEQPRKTKKQKTVAVRNKINTNLY